ncbi:MAG TPA: alpha/beta hydrolase-fold protein, partial [Polyangia bacterium]
GATLWGGCSSSGGPADAGPPDMMTPTAAELLAERPYAVSVPPGYSDAQTWPLVIVLAGFGGIGTETAAYLGFTQLAADQGLFLVAPDADPLRARYAWDPGPAHFPNFDVEYLTAIIHDVEGKYAIDHGRVFVVGHSLGAHMAHRMACDASADVAAIMSLAGQVSKVPSECAPAQAVSVVEIHGTADQTIGYYGDVQNNPPDPAIPSAHETVGVWARNDACTGAIALTGVTLDLDTALAGSETTVEAYAGCPSGVGVELWSIVGGVHRPQLTPGFATLVWGFLSAHARR